MKDGRKGFPDHGMILTKATAWDLVRVGLESAKAKGSKVNWQPDKRVYLTFAKNEFPKKFVSQDVIVMTVPLEFPDPKKSGKSTTLYFGVELDSATGVTMTSPQVIDLKPVMGRHFSVKYKVALSKAWRPSLRNTIRNQR